MKWGDSYKVETPTFDPDSGMKLEFRGTKTDCTKPYHLFHLIKYPGLLLGKIRIPVGNTLPDMDKIKISVENINA